MKEKVIKSLLSRKLNTWIDSIDNPELQTLLKRDTIVSGGAITSLVLGEPVKDFDLYFQTAETTYRVAEYYIKQFKQDAPPRFQDKAGACYPIFLANNKGLETKSFEAWAREDPTGRVRIVVQSKGVVSETGANVYNQLDGIPDADSAGGLLEDMQAIDIALGPDDLLSPTAMKRQAEEDAAAATPVSVTDFGSRPEKKKTSQGNDGKKLYRPVHITSNAITLSDKIQLTVRFYGKPEEIHGNYDFKHCMCYYRLQDGHLSLPSDSLMCMINRTLVYEGSRFPVCSIFRARKFLERGWKINAGQLLKMALQISNLDLRDIKVLEEQLIGVDTAYFSAIILDMSEHMQKNQLERVDESYLISLINKIF